MIRAYRPSDAGALLEQNAANVPDVGPLDRTKLEFLVGEALLVEVLELGGKLEGAIVVLADGGTYRSPNYRWFAERHPEFAYVDRVMLSAATRGQGWGVSMYERAVNAARAAGKTVLAAEVNIEPPNPRSIRFHERFGFVEVGRLRPYDPDEEVALFELTLGKAWHRSATAVVVPSMKTATLHGVTVAQSDRTVVVEGNHYFPPDAINWEYFVKTDHQTVCPWKGTASYYSITVDGEKSENSAWTYETPKDAAAEIKDHVAFYPVVSVT